MRMKRGWVSVPGFSCGSAFSALGVSVAGTRLTSKSSASKPGWLAPFHSVLLERFWVHGQMEQQGTRFSVRSRPHLMHSHLSVTAPQTHTFVAIDGSYANTSVAPQIHSLR
jgi:hypothetical protein